MKPTLESLPLSISKPESDAPEVAPDDNTIRGSLTVMFSVFNVVVVPLTVKLPLTITSLPVIFPEVEILSVNVNPLAFVVLKAPLLIVTSPIVALVVTVSVELDTNASAVIPLSAS